MRFIAASDPSASVKRGAPAAPLSFPSITTSRALFDLDERDKLLMLYRKEMAHG